jgi:hypothetical protein
MNIGKRIILMVVYEAASLVAGLFFVGGGGRGPQQGFAILTSWSFVVARTLSRAIRDSETTTPELMFLNLLAFLIVLHSTYLA